MKILSLLSVLLSFIVLASPACADEVFECHGPKTLYGHDGWLIKITDTDDNGGPTLFVRDEDGFIRLYAEQPEGSTGWGINLSQPHIVPTSTMDIGDEWPSVRMDGEPSSATCSSIESITTVAGNFATAYRVDIRIEGDSTIQESQWWADGVGLVRKVGYDGGPGGTLVYQNDLTSFTHVGGSGFLPLATGNTWTFGLVPVANATGSMGELKAQYR